MRVPGGQSGGKRQFHPAGKEGFGSAWKPRAQRRFGGKQAESPKSIGPMGMGLVPVAQSNLSGAAPPDSQQSASSRGRSPTRLRAIVAPSRSDTWVGRRRPERLRSLPKTK